MPDIVTSPQTILLRRLAEMGMSEDEFIEKLKILLRDKEGYNEFWAGLLAPDTTYVLDKEAPHYEAITGIPAKIWIAQSKRYDDYCLDLLKEAIEKDPLFMDKTLNPEKYEG